MKFTEYKALKILKENPQLHVLNFYRWKNNGKIPDKYFHKKGPVNDITQKKIKTILYNNKIKLKEFSQRADILYSRSLCIRNGQTIMNKNDYDKIKNTTDLIIKEIKKMISEYDTKTPEGNYYPLLDFINQHKELLIIKIIEDKNIINWKYTLYTASNEKIQKWLNKLKIFCSEIKI